MNSRSLAEAEETEEYGLEGREEGCLSVFKGWGGKRQQKQKQQQQWGLQWEKYQQHYEVGLSLPSLSMRGRGLSERTKEKKTIPDKEERRDGEKEKREQEGKDTRGGQREGLKKQPQLETDEELRRSLMGESDKAAQTHGGQN